MRFLFLLLFQFCLSAAPLKVGISSEMAILMNAETGVVLFEKNGYKPAYPASITKVATALYLLEKKGNALHENATATQECLLTAAPHERDAHPPYRLWTDGTKMGLRVGEVVTLKTLLYGLLLCSGNDAANVIAEHTSGSIEKFMRDLNIFLKEKGIKNTTFVTPHGQHHPNHQTTAYDMALITREAIKNPIFREVTGSVKYLKPQSNKQKAVEIIQNNQLLKPGQYYFPKVIGGKSGFLSKAGFTLTVAAEHEGRTLIAVVLNAPDAGQRYKDAIKLFETAFAEKKIERTLFTADHDHFWLELKKGKNPLEAALGEDLVLSYYPAEELLFKAHIQWDRVRLPIHAGQEVGSLQLLTDRGVCLKSAPIFAVKSVDRTIFAAFTDLCYEHKVFLIALAMFLMIFAALFYLLKKPKKIIQR